MKSVAEIKKSVKICMNHESCTGCPYEGTDCLTEQSEDILAVIRQFEEQSDQRELDFAKLTTKAAAERLEMLKVVDDYCKQLSGWISVEERLPDNDVPVLVSSEKNAGNGKVYNVVFTAFHTDGTTHTEDSEYGWDYDYLGMKYCEETDDYIVPEAWWEDVHFGEEFSIVPDYVKITHWMPLPKPRKEDQ